MHLHTQFEGQSSVLSWEVMGHQWNGRELVVRQQIQQSHGPVQCGTLHCSQRAVWHQQNQIQSKCSPSFCKCICKSLFDSVILPCRSSARVESFSYGTPNRPEYTRSTRLILKSSSSFFFLEHDPFYSLITSQEKVKHIWGLAGRHSRKHWRNN